MSTLLAFVGVFVFAWYLGHRFATISRKVDDRLALDLEEIDRHREMSRALESWSEYQRRNGAAS